MSIDNISVNGVNGAGTDNSEGLAPGSCSVRTQADSGRHPMTARNKTSRTAWSKEVNKLVMKCFYASEPSKRGYRKRMFAKWQEIGVFTVSEQRLADQVRAIKNNGFLSNIELEEIEGNIMMKENNSTSQERIDITESSEEIHNCIGSEVLGTDRSDIYFESDATVSDEEIEILNLIKAKIENPSSLESVNLRAMDRRKVKQKLGIVNEVIDKVISRDITETNVLILAAANVVADLVNRKKSQKKNAIPVWKKRLLRQIAEIRKDLSRVEKWRDGRLKSESLKGCLEGKYHVWRKGFVATVEELKQRIKTKTTKIKKYEERNNQYIQNRLFQTNQKLLFEKIEGIERNNDIRPNALESKAFWSNIWSKDVEYNNEASWIKEIEQHVESVRKQADIKVTLHSLQLQLRKVPKWKACGPDKVHGYWIKGFTKLHPLMAAQLNECITIGETPSWMTRGRTCLILKDVKKGSDVTNFRPITCLPLMWKVLTGIVSESVYHHLESEKLLPEEQKGCRKNSRGTKDQLMIDKMVMKNCKRRLTNLCVAWIDYKKAYDMVPHSWILACLRMFKLADNVFNLIENSMSSWTVDLTSGGEMLGQVKIKRGIFQGDSLSPILFVLTMIPLSIVLNNLKVGYLLGRNRGKLNHLLFMDDLKLYGKSMSELDSLVEATRIYSQDIGMEFGISKCAMLEMKRGKMVASNGLELPSGEIIKALESSDGYKYLGIIQCDTTMNKNMKQILTKEYFRRIRKILKSNLNAGNTIQAINLRAVSIIRYGAGIVDWRKAELQQMDRKTRKLLTIYRSMHSQGDVDRTYMKRSKGGRGLISIEECVMLESTSLGFYVNGKEEVLLQEVVKEGFMGENENPKILKDRLRKAREERYYNKSLHSVFFRETEEGRDENNSWLWVKKGYLKKETEGLIMAAQDQAIRTNWIRHNIDKEDISPLCRLCGARAETVSHIVSECKELAQTEYKKIRHDKVAAILHWQFCQKYGFPTTAKSYEHFIDKEMTVLENEEIKLLWDFSIQTEMKIEHNKPDLVLLDKKERICYIIDVACPFDTRVEKKEKEKFEHYTDLKYELLKVWNTEVTKVYIIPIVIGALGIVTKNIVKYLEKIDFKPGLEPLQKACLLGTARIIRKVLDYNQ